MSEGVFRFFNSGSLNVHLSSKRGKEEFLIVALPFGECQPLERLATVLCFMSHCVVYLRSVSYSCNCYNYIIVVLHVSLYCCIESSYTLKSGLVMQLLISVSSYHHIFVIYL